LFGIIPRKNLPNIILSLNVHFECAISTTYTAVVAGWKYAVKYIQDSRLEWDSILDAPFYGIIVTPR